VVVRLEQGADLHMAQLMPLPLTVSCFSKIQIGFAFLVLAHLGSPGKRAVKRVCVCVCVWHIIINFISKRKKTTVYGLLVCSFSFASITDVISTFRRQQRFFPLFLLAAAVNT